MVLQQQKKQRFRPPKPERPLCKRFSLPEGCPFHDECTHLHSLDGIHDVRDALEVAHADAGGTTGTAGTAPRVFLHKMEDRKVGKGSISLIIRTLATGGFVQTNEPGDADLVLANAFPSSNLLSKIPPGCTINHFPGEHELCCKDRMAKLLRGMPFCPETFILPEEEKQFEAVLSGEPEGIWILKPCQLGEGRHIEIVQGLNLVLPERRQRLQRCTASRYLANPLLIEGRKVDLRVYVVVTQLSPVLRALIFREGLVRFCSGSYREAGLEELGAHISNNAVQTKTTRHASGQNWTLEQLWCHLSKTGICSETVWRRIVRTARDALTLWQTKALAYVTDVTIQTNESELHQLVAFEPLKGSILFPARCISNSSRFSKSALISTFLNPSCLFQPGTQLQPQCGYGSAVHFFYSCFFLNVFGYLQLVRTRLHCRGLYVSDHRSMKATSNKTYSEHMKPVTEATNATA